LVRAFSAGLVIAEHASGSAADIEIQRLYEFLAVTLNQYSAAAPGSR
jgi:hypothetical protein